MHIRNLSILQELFWNEIDLSIWWLLFNGWLPIDEVKEIKFWQIDDQ